MECDFGSVFQRGIPVYHLYGNGWTYEYAERGRKDMDVNNKKDVLEELHYLKDIIHGVGLPADVMNEENGFPGPTLLIAVPQEEEEIRKEEEDHQFVMVSFMPTPQEEAEYSVFLQIYTDVDIPENACKEEVFYRAASRANQILPMGGCFYIPENEEYGIPQKFGIRQIMTANKERHIEDTTFCETLFFLIYSYEYMEMVAKELAKGKSPEEIIPL